MNVNCLANNGDAMDKRVRAQKKKTITTTKTQYCYKCGKNNSEANAHSEQASKRLMTQRNRQVVAFECCKLLKFFELLC